MALTEWDVVEGLRCPLGTISDRSETRIPLPRLPGDDIADVKGTQSGACVVLGNGPSVATTDIRAFRLPVIGCNRTFPGFPGYDGPDPDWYCAIDTLWIERGEIRNRRGLVNMSQHHAPIGLRVSKSYRMDPWSFDLARDGVVPVDTGYCAMQVAVYLGFTELLLVGFEGKGGHFDGSGAPGMRDKTSYMTRAPDVLRGVAEVFTVGFETPALERVA